MQITMGAEFALTLQLDAEITYAALEGALVDAGFNNYVILRTVNYDGTCDVQLYVRSAVDQNGQPGRLDAADTMQALTQAVEALVEEEPAQPNFAPADNSAEQPEE